MGWELETVEKPFVEQLLTMGWRHVEGDLDAPARTGRTTFTEVIQEAPLRRQLNALTLGRPERCEELVEVSFAAALLPASPNTPKSAAWVRGRDH